MPHVGGLSFFKNILNEDINIDSNSKKEVLKIAFAYCKKEMKNSRMTMGEKAKFIAGFPKLVNDSENHVRILKQAMNQIENPQNTFPLNKEWAEYFFEYSKKITDKDIQKILGKILAEELQNKDKDNAYSETAGISDEYFNKAIENMKITG
jgi:hypothetical protein